MVKCPKCGSAAQIKEFDTLYQEDGNVIIVERRYHCNCNHYFHTLQIYEAIDIEETDE